MEEEARMNWLNETDPSHESHALLTVSEEEVKGALTISVIYSGLIQGAASKWN
jgi:hypothetical protein